MTTDTEMVKWLHQSFVDADERDEFVSAVNEQMRRQAASPFCAKPLRRARWRVRHRLGRVLGIKAK